MAGRKSDFTLPKFDDIFSTQEMRDDEKLAKIRDIPLTPRSTDEILIRLCVVVRVQVKPVSTVNRI